MASGCLSEVFNAMPAGIPVHFSDFYTKTMGGLKTVKKVGAMVTDRDDELARNCCFGLGVLAEKAPTLLSATLNDTLSSKFLILTLSSDPRCC
jgi:hypothetical protein